MISKKENNGCSTHVLYLDVTSFKPVILSLFFDKSRTYTNHILPYLVLMALNYIYMIFLLSSQVKVMDFLNPNLEF